MMYPFNYPGNKLHVVSRLAAYSGRSDTLYELFTGSGVVVYNLEARKKVACEIDPHVFAMHKAIQTFEYGDYAKLCTFVGKRWKLHIVEDYFKYREWFNTTLWQTQHQKMGLGLLLLAGSCMNALIRFGPNGFNQGSGERQNIFSEKEYTQLHQAASKIRFVNDDYRNLTIPKDATVFADPPYLENKCGTYDEAWSRADLRALLKLVSTRRFFYTDTENSTNLSFCKYHNLKPVILKQMKKQSPGGKKGQAWTGRNELLITNLRMPSIFD